MELAYLRRLSGKGLREITRMHAAGCQAINRRSGILATLWLLSLTSQMLLIGLSNIVRTFYLLRFAGVVRFAD